MRIFRPLLVLTALMLTLCFELSAQEALPSTIKNISFDSRQQVLTVLSSDPLTPKIQYLVDQQPGKIVLDLPNSIFPPVRQELAAAGSIEKIRVSQFQNQPPTVRMVLDLLRPLEIAVRTRRVEGGYETRIESAQNTPMPQQTLSGKGELLDVRLVGQNLVLEASSPIFPEVRQLNKDKTEYLLSLYDFTTKLDGPQLKLQSSLIESVTVTQETKGVQLRLRLKRNDVEIVPFSQDQFCTLQLLVKATDRNQAKFTDLQIDELGSQTTRVRLFADKAFDFQVYPLGNPHRLVIDTMGTNMGSLALERKLTNSQNIRSVRLNPTQPETQTDVRVVLDLQGEAQYQFNWNGNYLEIVLQNRRPIIPDPIQTVSPPLRGRPLVVIDPGHGGNDPGALGVRKNKEKDVTLAVSQYLSRYLENDSIQTLLTRQEDLEVLLLPRVNVANLRNADLFVSIHCNSMPPNNTHVRGIETYYTTPQSKQLADTLHRYLVTELGAQDRRVRLRGLYVTRHTKMPSVLLEIGFLSSPDEESLLSNPEYQRRVAKAIRDGIYDYLSRNQKLKPAV